MLERAAGVCRVGCRVGGWRQRAGRIREDLTPSHNYYETMRVFVERRLSGLLDFSHAEGPHPNSPWGFYNKWPRRVTRRNAMRRPAPLPCRRRTHLRGPTLRHVVLNL